MKIRVKNIIQTILSVCLLAMLGISSFAMAQTQPLPYRIDRFKGSYYDISYVTLLRGGNKVVINQVNSKVRTDLRIGKEPCESAEGSTYEGGVAGITVLPNKMLSFQVASSYFCSGSAHPDSEQSGFTFDLSTGNKLNMKSQFINGDTSVLDNLLFAEANKAPPGGDCNASELQASVGYTAADFYLTGSTMVVWNQFPHVATACDVQISIPLNNLKDKLIVGSLADRIRRNKP